MTAAPATELAGRTARAPRDGTRRPAGLNVIILVMAVACGLTVANRYYAQPLLALMTSSFRVSQGTAAIVVTATQLGYAAGPAFLVPLGDVLENRKPWGSV